MAGDDARDVEGEPGAMRPRVRHGSTLSLQRAFVVHLAAGRSRTRRRFSGRVEHLASGESAHFSSLRDLLAFLDRKRSPPAGEPS
jgi:hypothetical protein